MKITNFYRIELKKEDGSIEDNKAMQSFHAYKYPVRCYVKPVNKSTWITYILLLFKKIHLLLVK